MASLFGGRTAGDNQSGQKYKTTGGSPEVETHTYEGAPSIDENSDSDTLGLKKTREALFGSRTQHQTNSTTRTFEEAASRLSQFTDDAPVPNSTNDGGFAAQDRASLVKPTGVFVSEEGLVRGKRYADRPEGIDQFGAEEGERDPAFPAESEGRLDAGAAASFARFKDQPEGLDHFGGEGSEHDRVEGRGSEARTVE